MIKKKRILLAVLLSMTFVSCEDYEIKQRIWTTDRVVYITTSTFIGHGLFNIDKRLELYKRNHTQDLSLVDSILHADFEMSKHQALKTVEFNKKYKDLGYE